MRERHHIIFKSQGGLDFELNYIDLTPEEHRGDNGPHKCRSVDLRYKEKLERDLRGLLGQDRYSINELIEILGLKENQAYRAFKSLTRTSEGISKEDIIQRLLGGRFYL